MLKTKNTQKLCVQNSLSKTTQFRDFVEKTPKNGLKTAVLNKNGISECCNFAFSRVLNNLGIV